MMPLLGPAAMTPGRIGLSLRDAAAQLLDALREKRQRTRAGRAPDARRTRAGRAPLPFRFEVRFERSFWRLRSCGTCGATPGAFDVGGACGAASCPTGPAICQPSTAPARPKKKCNNSKPARSKTGNKADARRTRAGRARSRFSQRAARGWVGSPRPQAAQLARRAARRAAQLAARRLRPRRQARQHRRLPRDAG
eukprot:gene11949-biopygen18441